MAETPQQPTALEPLRALRYDQARVDLAGVVAPPYDVISPADRELYLQRDPHSVVNLILPESPVHAADLLHEWRRDGVLARDVEPAIWWHEQRFVGPDGSERSRAGFLSAVRLWPYDSGRVRPHEQTHASAKQNRLDLIRATRTNLSPIFGLYDDPDGGPRTALAGVAERAPDMRVLDGDGTDHRFWAVTDPAAIAATQAALADCEILIADGHHRYETALNYQRERREADGNPSGDRPYDFMLMYLANLHGEGLSIFPTHRVVMGARELTPDLLHAFAVRELTTTPAELERELAAIPPETIAFGVWRGSHRPALLCTLKDRSAVMMAMSGSPAAVRKIDAAVLESVILAPMLGLLEDPDQFGTTDAVRYVRDLDTAVGFVDAGDSAAAFLLRAPTVPQVQEVARAGRVMPQKSTYFYPKLYSGFLLNPLED